MTHQNMVRSRHICIYIFLFYDFVSLILHFYWLSVSNDTNQSFCEGLKEVKMACCALIHIEGFIAVEGRD